MLSQRNRHRARLTDAQRRVLQALYDAGGSITVADEYALCTPDGARYGRAFNNNTTTVLCDRGYIETWRTFRESPGRRWPRDWDRRTGWRLTQLGSEALHA